MVVGLAARRWWSSEVTWPARSPLSTWRNAQPARGSQVKSWSDVGRSGKSRRTSRTDSLPRSPTTWTTWMDRVMWWMNAMNIATLAATSTNATVTDSCGTNA